jgi:sulfur carrier protein ThiS adenylyltransferase
MNQHSEQDRYERQKNIVPIERLARCSVTIVGVGAIGRQVALQLTAIGIPRLQLIDFDIVKETNLASQGYLEEDLGKLKVEVTADLSRKINSGIILEEIPERFKRCQTSSKVRFNQPTKEVDPKKSISFFF